MANRREFMAILAWGERPGSCRDGVPGGKDDRKGGKNNGLRGEGFFEAHRDGRLQRDPAEEPFHPVRGYVTNTNKVLDTLAQMLKDGKAAPTSTPS